MIQTTKLINQIMKHQNTSIDSYFEPLIKEYIELCFSNIIEKEDPSMITIKDLCQKALLLMQNDTVMLCEAKKQGHFLVASDKTKDNIRTIAQIILQNELENITTA